MSGAAKPGRPQAGPAALGRDLLHLYGGDGKRYDELLDEAGRMRGYWRPLLDRVVELGPDSAREILELAHRLIVENGVTYNVYADPKGKDRPWSLDPLPFLMEASEWREMEAGVAQRAELLNLLLADLYGPQHLLAEGIIPPEIPFGHPNFLWPCQRIAPPGGRWLHVYAADLAHAPDGRWWILGDRTQTPSGAGYALENREIVTRLFSEPIAPLQVRPLEDFFAALREQLLSAIDPAEPPLAVVLTPGPFNETYFEHVYLARQMGLALVEGHDLTVRKRIVYLKTLGGLKRVHAILRRIDDDFCDPLELRGDSALGLPGLISAVRAGTVVLANALGSGVLESAAWLGFMPSIAQRLLGEELRLPSLATWWCGERPALDYVIGNLDGLVLKPTYPNQRFEPVFGSELDAAERDSYCRRLRDRPHAYVAQERVALSRAPVWPTGDALGFRARSLGLRVYAIATPGGYRVMPGGLARIAAGTHDDVLSTQRGGRTKDFWVLSDNPSDGAPEPPAVLPLLSPRHDELPSRLVENLYWLGRYSQRCEDKTRLLRATFAVRSRAQMWKRGLDTCFRFGAISSRDPAAKDPAAKDLPAKDSLDRPRGRLELTELAADLRRLGVCASEIRTRLSLETWRIICRLASVLQKNPAVSFDLGERLDNLLLELGALAARTFDHLTQDDGWKFMMVGRRLEGVQFMALLLADRLDGESPPLKADLEWLLDVGDSVISYRTRFVYTPQLGAVIDLLVHERQNPRSLMYQWLRIRQLMIELGNSLDTASDDGLTAAIAELSETSGWAIDGAGPNALQAQAVLGRRLVAAASAARHLCHLLSAKHFSHTEYELHAVAT